MMAKHSTNLSGCMVMVYMIVTDPGIRSMTDCAPILPG